MTINGGDTINIPAGLAISSDGLFATLTEPVTFIFTNTAVFYIEYLSP